MTPTCLLLMGVLLVGQRSFVDPAALPNPQPHPPDHHHEPVTPTTTETNKPESKDAEVRELENLKQAENDDDKSISYVKTHSSSIADINGHKVEHEADKEYVHEDGKLVASVKQEVDKVVQPDSPPEVHSKTEVDIPSEGIHKTIVHSGHHATTEKHDDEEQKEMGKSFPGAARLMQSAPSAPQLAFPPALAVARRATQPAPLPIFNADITRETEGNVDHFNSYLGVQYSPLDMAEYIFWTGDEKGVTMAVEEFLQNGLMTKEEAIMFLQEIKYNIDYLQSHYSQHRTNDMADDQLRRGFNSLQGQDVGQLYSQRDLNIFHNQRPPLPYPYDSNLEMMKTIANGNYERNNNIIPSLSFPVTTLNMENRQYKRNMQDAMLETNIIGTSDYDKDAMSLEGDYEELLEKLRVADFLYTEYSMEEVIYQLAKAMFTQSLSRGSIEAQISLQKFTNFLEVEAEQGRISRSLEKKVLDVLIAALTDTLTDHPELVATAREGLGGASPAPAGNRLLHHLMELGPTDHLSRVGLMQAYKEEVAKIQNMHNQINSHHPWKYTQETGIADEKPLGFLPMNPYTKRA